MKNYNDELIKFSVLIPVYNVENHIEDCLQSVLNQTYSNFEVIITNDGSTDRSGQICKEYALKDERIQVYSQRNQGLLMARRNSIALSSGDYCLFLDSDDSWKNNTLEVIYNTIRDTRADMIIFNWDRVLMDEMVVSEPLFSDREEFSGNSKNKLIESFITTDKLNSLCLKAIKTSLIDKEKDYSYASGLTMGEDAIQSIPFFLNSKKIVYIQNALYNYRMNEDSATNHFNSRHIIDINIANEHKIKLAKELNRPDLVNTVSKRYVNIISKQIMLASASNMSKSEKIRYLQDIQSSNIYKDIRENFISSELLFPVKLIINELDNNRYKNVLKLGKMFNFFWNNLDGLREHIRYKVQF